MKNNKNVVFMLLVFGSLVFACTPENTYVPRKSTKVHDDFQRNIKSEDYLENQLIRLKKAVTERDKATIKTFFHFPVVNDHNEIWYHINTSGEEIESSNRAFTEKDFDTYFDQFFPKSFSNFWQKLDVNQLVQKGEFSTDPEKVAASYEQLHFELGSKELSVNWYSEVVVPENEDMPFEYSVIFKFGIDENSTIVFKELRIAG